MTVTQNQLPDAVGRVLGVDERPRPVSFLVDSVVCDAGMTAIALPDQRMRTAIGVEIVRGLLDPGVGLVLGHRVPRQVASVLVLATSKSVASIYRAATAGDARMTVAAVRGWDGTSTDYWPSLRQLADTHELVLVDTVQGLANGNLGWRHVQALDEFRPPMVGLYAGNETKAGIGGDVGWSFAVRRFWYGGKPSQLHSLDTDDLPRSIDVSPVSVPRSMAASNSVTSTAEQVRQLGELARSFDQRGSVRTIAGQLLNDRMTEVTAICGRSIEYVAELAKLIDTHADAWKAGLTRKPTATPDYDEPPF